MQKTSKSANFAIRRFGLSLLPFSDLPFFIVTLNLFQGLIMELGSIIGENNSQSASRPKKFLITVMLGLDPSIQPAERKSAGMRFF